MPKVAELYKEIYGWVERGNQQLLYYNTEFRSVHKQNRVHDSLIEKYVSVNGHTLWRNSPNLMCNVTRENMSQSEFKFPLYVFGMQCSDRQMKEWRSFTPQTNSPPTKSRNDCNFTKRGD